MSNPRPEPTPRALRTESVLVSAGRPHLPGAPVATPIVLTAPYRHRDGGNDYSRSAVTDTVAAFEQAVGALEGGHALAFASGMAAITTALQVLVDEARAASRGVLVVPRTGYSGSITAFGELARTGIEVRRVDITDLDAVTAALDGAGVLWVETVSNPLMDVADLPALVAAAHAAGARVGVDATFSTPLGVRALALGADVVMQSVTKYLSGHSDVLMGSLAVTDAPLLQRLHARRTLTGAIPGALESYLALRGLRTLAVRFERAQANAGELARRLVTHPAVTRVRYPGLPDDPGHAVASRVLAGYGAMIGIEVAGDAATADAACGRLRLITDATSLGGVESLIERRAQHAIDAEFGTPATLLRLSVGIEHVEDLWDDLVTALDGIVAAG